MFLFLFLFFSMLLITMRIFQIKRIISSEKWLNYVVTFFLENDKNLSRSDDAKRRKKEDGLIERFTFFIPRLIFPFTEFIPICSFPTLKICRRVSELCLLPQT